MATTRRRFTAQFKAKVAMEALRGDRTIQAIAAKHEVHPNQVSGWKRQAQAGLQELFAGASNRRQKDHDATIHDLHAKIGELTVERDFLSRGLGRPPVGGNAAGAAYCHHYLVTENCWGYTRSLDKFSKCDRVENWNG